MPTIFSLQHRHASVYDLTYYKLYYSLDENAIKYGRTGVWPDSSTSKKDPYTIINKSNVMVQVQGVSNSPGDGFTTQPTTASFGGRESISPTFLSPILLSPMNSRPGSTSPHHLAPPKSTSSFAVVSGRDNVRSLSPAEQVNLPFYRFDYFFNGLITEASILRVPFSIISFLYFNMHEISLLAVNSGILHFNF